MTFGIPASANDVPASEMDSYTCARAKGDEAIAACGRIIKLGLAAMSAQTLSSTLDMRGVLYENKGDHDRAIADFDQAIKLDPRNALAYIHRSEIHRKRADSDRAIADAGQAIKLSPKSTAAYAIRGNAYAEKGEYDRAIDDFAEQIRLDPKNAIAFINRGLAYDNKGDRDRAVADFNQAAKLNPTLAAARINRQRAQDAAALPQTPAKPQTAPLSQSDSTPAFQASPSPGSPERRVALVIGNSQYRSARFLPNPRRDAKAVADILRQVGFQSVELAMDLDRDAMVKALRSFRSQADTADWALIYFAGHGIEINRTNYLIPVDAKLADDRDVKAETVSYEELLSTISSARLLRLVILDACRVNPFKDYMRRTVASRGDAERGLAPPPESEPGTLVVYSAKDGEVAMDDIDGVNSPFARAFVAELKVPGREVRRMFDYVRDDVLDATNKRQQPFTYGSLPGRRDFFFVSAN